MVEGAHYSLETRALALGLVVCGQTLETVEARLGLGVGAVSRWARLAGMKIKRGAPGGPERPILLRQIGAPAGQGRRLSLVDRVRIQTERDRGASIRQIARTIDAAASTISRELARALSYRGQTRYDALVAEQVATDRRARHRPARLDENLELRRVVVGHLNDKLSPEQVVGRLTKDFPDQEEMRVSHETIYQALYVQGKGALRHELTVTKALRSGRTSRKPVSKLPARSNRPWLDGARLADRPKTVEDRAVPGAWEGDLVVGPGNSGLVTLVERSSRFALIGRLPGARDSETVIDVLTRLAGQIPEALMTSLTWDQGQEMARHAEFTIATGCPVFFCDPHSPWQRGSNENLNGLIRDFYPKGTDFNAVIDADIAEMQRLLNKRPRKTLDFATPAETLDEFIRSVALTT